MNKRIMQLCLSPNLGGLELYMHRLSMFLRPRIVTHITIAEQSRLLTKFTEDQQRLVLRRSSWKNIFHNARALARYIDDNKIDCLHMHWTKDLPLCVFAIKLSQRQPKLIQSRHMNMTRFKSDFYHRYLYKKIDLMIAVTRQVKQQITHFVPKDICPNVTVSYIGAAPYQPVSSQTYIALRQQYNLGDNFVIALAGRIEPAKGQAILIEALQKLDKCNIKLLLIGDAMEADYLAQLKADIAESQLTDDIVFTGFADNVQDLMAISDCVVLATDKETFGMVIIEAMHTGTAVIASNSGGPLEIIEDKKDGLLFESGDPDNLAEKLTYYIENPESQKQIAHSGKETAKHRFDQDKQFKEIENILTNA